MSSVTVVIVFGNPVEPKDSLAVRLVPELKKKFPKIEFRIEDPTESLEPTGDPWVILDVAEGIDKVTVIDNLKDLEQIHGDSVHDYDVYMELRLKEKLGQLTKIKLILLPVDMHHERALEKTVEYIRNL